MMHQVVQNGRNHAWRECEQYKQCLAPPDHSWPADVRAVAAYIFANLFDDNLTVEKIKQVCGIGDNNIAGRFRYYVGCGIKEYIDNHRMNLAKRLLLCNNSSILAIALEVGYPSHSAFATSFKRRTGYTPAEYRIQCREMKRES